MTNGSLRNIALPQTPRPPRSLPGSLPRVPVREALESNQDNSAQVHKTPALPGALPPKGGTTTQVKPAGSAAPLRPVAPKPATPSPVEPVSSEQGLPRRTTQALPARTPSALPVVGGPVAPALAVPVVEAGPSPVAQASHDEFETHAPQANTAPRTSGSLPVSTATKKIPVPKPRIKKAKTTPKGNKGFRPTQRDRVILRLLYFYFLLTNDHLAYYFDASADTIRKRMTVLANEGLVEHDDRAAKRVWQITNAGIDFIREKGRTPRQFPSHMKFHHTLCIATVGLILEKGGQASSDLTENILSEAPRVFITEREMQVMEARREKDFIRSNWDRLTTELLTDQDYPAFELRFHTQDVEAYFDSQGLSDEQRAEQYLNLVEHETKQKEVLNERWRGNKTHTGYCHLVTSNNPSITKTGSLGGNSYTYATSHRPDGLIAMPHIIDENGVVRGGSIAVEVELNNKATKAEYMNTILHQWNHPAYDGVLWFFDDAEAKRMFKEAMRALSERYNPPFTLDEAKAYFKPLRLHYLSDDSHGTYG